MQAEKEQSGKRIAHVKFVQKKTLTYYKKNDLAALGPSRFCSITMDGANQSAFELPQFVSCTMNDKDHWLKVCLIELLDNRKSNKLYLCKMPDGHGTGANNVTEAIHRFIIQRASSPFLLDTLLVQFENCTREKRTGTCLRAWNVYCIGSSIRVLQMTFLRLATHVKTLNKL